MDWYGDGSYENLPGACVDHVSYDYNGIGTYIMSLFASDGWYWESKHISKIISVLANPYSNQVSQASLLETFEDCIDEKDNDCDGLVDCDDSDCSTYYLCSCTPATEICDKLDNDCDGEFDEGGVCDFLTYPEEGLIAYYDFEEVEKSETPFINKVFDKSGNDQIGHIGYGDIVSGGKKGKGFQVKCINELYNYWLNSASWV